MFEEHIQFWAQVRVHFKFKLKPRSSFLSKRFFFSFFFDSYIFIVSLRNLHCCDDFKRRATKWVTGRARERRRGRYFKSEREEEKKMTAAKTLHITWPHITLDLVDKNTPGRGGGKWLVGCRVKRLGLQSAATSSINSHSLLSESASYTSAVHVYIHHTC